MSNPTPSSPAALGAPSGSRLLGSLKKRLFMLLPSGRTTVIGVPFIWLAVFFAVPFVLVLKISFTDSRLGIPPYTDLLSAKDGVLHVVMQLGHYAFLLQDDLYVATYISSLKMAAVSTLCCLLIGYPVAYYIARSEPAKRNLLMMGVMLPFWTSFLIRVYAWIGILKDDGL
ncbi:putrescine ABC transporter permease PotH, partial [Paraburkholderia sp. 5N]|nr:putrescine ABC transporter permease PotH [Paraburkholderia elongata]